MRSRVTGRRSVDWSFNSDGILRQGRTRCQRRIAKARGSERTHAYEPGLRSSGEPEFSPSWNPIGEWLRQGASRQREGAACPSCSTERRPTPVRQALEDGDCQHLMRNGTDPSLRNSRSAASGSSGPEADQGTVTLLPRHAPSCGGKSVTHPLGTRCYRSVRKDKTYGHHSREQFRLLRQQARTGVYEWRNSRRIDALRMRIARPTASRE